MTKLTDLKTTAEAILYFDKRYPNLLPPTTIKLLVSGIKNGNSEKLTTAIRRANKHSDVFMKEIETDAQIEQLIEEETEIELIATELEDKKLEAISIHNFLEEHRGYIHPSKRVRFSTFLDELETLLDRKSVDHTEIENIDAWIKRGNDFKAGIGSKLRQAPQQTRRSLVPA